MTGAGDTNVPDRGVSVGQRLERFVREHWDDPRGLVALSEVSDISRQALYSWFKGESSPDYTSLAKLAGALRVEPAALVAAMEGTEMPAGLRQQLDSLVAESVAKYLEAALGPALERTLQGNSSRSNYWNRLAEQRVNYAPSSPDEVDESEVVRVFSEHLRREGWTVGQHDQSRVAGRKPDIVATRDGQRLVAEVKGARAQSAARMRVGDAYWQLLTYMDDDARTRYAIVLPSQLIPTATRVGKKVRHRLNTELYEVTSDGKVVKHG